MLPVSYLSPDRHIRVVVLPRSASSTWVPIDGPGRVYAAQASIVYEVVIAQFTQTVHYYNTQSGWMDICPFVLSSFL